MEATFTRGQRLSHNPFGKQPRYWEPSPEEIKAACEAIQSSWSEEEKLARMFWYVDRVDHRGSKKVYRQDAPLDWSLRRPLTADLPVLETAIVSVNELEAA